MLVGQKVGPFMIERELGSGAMGTVYMAKFDREGKVVPVALKVVALGLLGNEGAMARFDRESAILKQLRHPHIVRLYATGKYKGTPFIAMEFVDGEALDRVLARRGRLGWEEVAGYGKHLCLALQHAHEKGIIHRDLKPSNLMVTREGALKLTDFGIAKDTDVTALTGMNSTIGTAAYMSPEQCKGDRNLTAKSDLYSLGVVFFELLTGRKPFTADTTVDMFLKHVHEKPPRVGKLLQDLPPKFETLILQLLEKDKDARPMDAAWVARMLGEIEEDATARKSAGLEAATARKVDRPRVAGTEAAPITDEDRDAARALKGRPRKKKRTKAVPFFQRTAVKAAAILLALGALAGGAYLILRPPSADALYAQVERVAEQAKTKDAVTADVKVETAERYLRAHGDTPGERTDAAAALFRAGTVEKAERILNTRFGSKMQNNNEGFDPEAYSAAITAIQAEKDGQLLTAVGLWGRVRTKFPDEAKLPYTFDEAALGKARVGWLGEKRVKDIEAAKAQLDSLRKKIVDARRFELATPFNPDSVESQAVRALRLEEFDDKEKARRTWDTAAGMAEKDSSLHVWFLLASERRGAITKVDPEAGLKKRREVVAGRVAEIERDEAAAKAATDRQALLWIGVRGKARDLVEVYDDETDAEFKAAVQKARGVLDAAKGK